MRRHDRCLKWLMLGLLVGAGGCARRLLDDDAGSLGATRLGKLFHDGPEEQGRDGRGTPHTSPRA
jgi:hypothetical protein